MNNVRRTIWRNLGILAYWMAWPGLWLVLRWSTRTRLAIMVGDEILVTKTWLGDGRWSLPGGGLHRGEDPVVGVLRELREETGVSLQPVDVRPFLTEQYHGHGLQFRALYFVAHMNHKPQLQLQRFEICASDWLRLDDDQLHKTAAPDVQAVIRALRYGPSRLGQA